MTIRITCPGGHQLVVRAEHAGRRVRCPRCREVVQAPGSVEGAVRQAAPSAGDSTETRIFACPTGHYFRAKVADLGKVVRCPSCSDPVRLPAPQPSSWATPGAAAAAPAVESAEKLWPLFLLVGAAATTLVSIAFWLRSQGIS